jgi:hypothetical protein
MDGQHGGHGGRVLGLDAVPYTHGRPVGRRRASAAAVVVLVLELAVVAVVQRRVQRPCFHARGQLTGAAPFLARFITTTSCRASRRSIATTPTIRRGSLPELLLECTTVPRVPFTMTTSAPASENPPPCASPLSHAATACACCLCSLSQVDLSVGANAPFPAPGLPHIGVAVSGGLEYALYVVLAHVTVAQCLCPVSSTRGRVHMA